MVSNHFQQAIGPLDKPWPIAPGTVHPRRLEETLKELRFHPNEIIDKQILPFIPDAATIDQEKDPRLAMVAKILAECTSIHAVATWLMENEPWDFMAVYYDAIDHFCHGFMKYHPPRQKFISEKDFELYKGVVEAGYRYHDMMLHRLLELAGEETTLILVSDHGFHPDHLRPSNIPREPAGPAVEHRDFGIFAMRGPGIKRDEYIHGTTLLDVTPTILTLLGLPVGDDMDGRPVIEAFEERPGINTVPSWEQIEGDDGGHRAEAQLDPVASREAINQLIALGYLEKPEPNRERSINATVCEQRYNLARSYMDADLHTEALSILRELYNAAPNEYRFGLQLAMCYRALGQIKELRALVEEMSTLRGKEAEDAQKRLGKLAEEITERKKQLDQTKKKLPEGESLEREKEERQKLVSPEQLAEIRQLRAAAQFSPYAVDYLKGFVEASEGRDEEALELLTQAEKADASRPGLHIQIGEAYLSLKRWTEAERAFGKAAEIDPDNPHAHLGLCRSYLGRGQPRRAVSEALAAVGLLYHYPLAHFYLGMALHGLGRLKPAAQALEVAVSLNPNFVEAHERLALLYEKRLNRKNMAAEHRRLADEIRNQAKQRLVNQAPPVAVNSTSSNGKGVKEPTAAARSQPWSQSIKDAAASGATRSSDDSDFVTVVTGLPRAGTSMMMKMLSDGGMMVLSDGIREADANNLRGYFEYEPVKKLQQDQTWLAEALGKAVKIVAQLLPFLPNKYSYRVLFMERDLEQVLASQKAMLDRQGRKGANLSEHQLKNIFESHLLKLKAWLLTQRNIKTLFVSYPAVVMDPHSASAAVKHFLGNSLDPEKTARAVESDLYRQRAASPPMLKLNGFERQE